MAKPSKRARSEQLQKATQQPQESSQQPQESPKAIVHTVFEIFQAHYSGPLPPPGILEKYNSAVPDGADRIIKMAEEEGNHRRAQEAKAVSRESRNSLLGIISAFILGMTSVIGGGYVVIQGHPWPGSLLSSVGLVGLVSVFIYGTKERRREREKEVKLSKD